MPKFTAHFTVFTTENSHFHFALTTFLTQNAYISALLAALLSQNVTRPPHTPDKMPKFTAHFTVFTTENAHFHFALTTFLTQNAYISALLAALYEISVYEMSIYEMSVYEVSDYQGSPLIRGKMSPDRCDPIKRSRMYINTTSRNP